MKARVYVDGFNLYYRALRRAPPGMKWLNLLEASKQLLDPADSVDCIKYFTAHVSGRAGNPQAPKRQHAYLRALKTLKEVEIYYGRFLPRTKWRPVVHPIWDPPVKIEVHDTEEKGSDVNLASHLLLDGCSGKYEVALVLSQDSDLCEPIRMVRDILGLDIGVVWLDGKEPTPSMTSCSSFVRHLRPAIISSSQFPDPIELKKGKPIKKPESW